jgi:L-threonylcarbamoyladenylate synthase
MCKIYSSFQYPDLINRIHDGEIGVLPTDTIYGIVCDAKNKESVEKIYTLRKRNREKPLIILLSSVDQIEQFDITLDDDSYDMLNRIYPAKLTVMIHHTSNPRFECLYQQSPYLAFRIPLHEELRDLIKLSGPIVAASANTQGMPPSENIIQAQDYFTDKINFYVDGGIIKSNPSTIVVLEMNNFSVVRQGDYYL